MALTRLRRRCGFHHIVAINVDGDSPCAEEEIFGTLETTPDAGEELLCRIVPDDGIDVEFVGARGIEMNGQTDFVRILQFLFGKERSKDLIDFGVDGAE